MDGAICKFRTNEPFWSLSGYERVFMTICFAYFMISEYWTSALQNLFVLTAEHFFLAYEPTFGLKNVRIHGPSNLRTFGLR